MSRNPGGRPSHQPTDRDRQMVEVLSGFAIPLERIAQVIGVSRPTLQRHYQTEINVGAAKVEATLIGNLLAIAKGKNGTALKAIMFSLHCRFGWSAYVPRPTEDKPLGKKEAAEIEAQTAHEDSEWSDLVH